MRKISLLYCALLACSLALTSCLNDSDSSVTTYSDVAITQFTLGTLNRYTHATSSNTGNDTIVKSTVSGSVYRMTIDHLQQRIYNLDPLPVGTDAQHVVCTVTTRNSGLVALKSATSDSLRWHSSTDSVDLSVPRIFRVYANDGSAFRDYEVTLNVSSTTGVAFAWQLVKDDEALAWTDGMRLEAWGDSVRLCPRDSIVGRSTAASYQLTSEGLFSSTDGGQTWHEEALDDNVQLLPDSAGATTVSWPYDSADNMDYVLLVGQPRQDDVVTMRVWRKLESHQGGEGKWVYMPFDHDNNYPLTLVYNVSLVYYDGKVLCVGDDLSMLESRDQGISWRASATYAMPSGLSGTHVAMAADTQGRLWLLTNSGQLWMGALR